MPVTHFRCEEQQFLIYTLLKKKSCPACKSEDTVLRKKIFGSKRQGGTGYWRKLRNEDPNYLCSFPYFSGVGRDERGMWHASGRITICTGFWLENLKERDFLDDLDIDGRVCSEFTCLRTEATGTRKQRNALIHELFLNLTA
jgi:hypothetical protein